MAAFAAAAGTLSLTATAQIRFASEKSAFTQGYSAYRGRQYEIAVPALKFAAGRGVIRAKFYLAKIYSDNSGGWTDHAKAYELLREIVSGYADVDPKDFRVAPFVSQALTSIARYERDGIAELGLKPNTARALAFFDHAASYFDDEDAQFELAKHYLAGDGVEASVPYALNWLAKLSKRGHAGAQAFLANIYWDGRYTKRDPARALALITVAVENAKEEDRFWIEDVHQNLFCEADAATRQRVHAVVDGWRKRFGRTPSINPGSSLANLRGDVPRTCANGDVVGRLDAPSNGLVSARRNPVTRRDRNQLIENGPAVDTAAGSHANGNVRNARDKDGDWDKRLLNGFATNKPVNGSVLRGGAATFGFSLRDASGRSLPAGR